MYDRRLNPSFDTPSRPAVEHSSSRRPGDHSPRSLSYHARSLGCTRRQRPPGALPPVFSETYGRRWPPSHCAHANRRPLYRSPRAMTVAPAPRSRASLQARLSLASDRRSIRYLYHSVYSVRSHHTARRSATTVPPRRPNHPLFTTPSGAATPAMSSLSTTVLWCPATAPAHATWKAGVRGLLAELMADEASTLGPPRLRAASWATSVRATRFGPATRNPCSRQRHPRATSVSSTLGYQVPVAPPLRIEGVLKEPQLCSLALWVISVLSDLRTVCIPSEVTRSSGVLSSCCSSRRWLAVTVPTSDIVLLGWPSRSVRRAEI